MFDPSIGSGTRFGKGVSGNPRGTARTRLTSEALRTRLAEVKPGDPAGRTYAEIVAANLIEIACTEGPGALVIPKVHVENIFSCRTNRIPPAFYC